VFKHPIDFCDLSVVVSEHRIDTRREALELRCVLTHHSNVLFYFVESTGDKKTNDRNEHRKHGSAGCKCKF